MRGRQIAMIFQDPMTSLNPTLTIGTQIDGDDAAAPRGLVATQARKRAVELLEEVRHPERATSASTTTRTGSRAACGSA